MGYQDYFRRLAEVLEQGNPVWQAQVIATDGSSPASVGMKLAVTPDTVFGNLGGGELEHRVIDYIRDQQPMSIHTFTYNLDANVPFEPQKQEAIKTGMICGGMASILIEPLHHAHPLYIIGGGHCGKALANLAQQVGFAVTVIDDRQDMLTPGSYASGIRLICHPYADVSSVISFSPQAFIVIMTHGHQHDKLVLAQCLEKSYRYLGMIGSKAKSAETLRQLEQEGMNKETLARVYTPIGIYIGSRTPEEIAVSITAQMIQVRNTQS